ncbi:MAG: aminomethyl-transferring glycine dehydrogenase subunit GcvPB, partial [Methanomassiliicoccales archaeon]
MYRQARYARSTIFELRGESDFCRTKVEGAVDLPEGMERGSRCLPELSEREVVKHYTNLSQMNFGVDNGFYPLGSCTMKYNPKYADALAALPQVTEMHPLQDEETCQGSLEVLYRLEKMLCAISGMDAVTLQPAAGAHGEFTGMLLARAYHEARGEKRTEVIVP